jgi:hypothetical protein
LKSPAVPDYIRRSRQVLGIGIDCAGQTEVDKGRGSKQQENKKKAEEYVVSYFQRHGSLDL